MYSCRVSLSQLPSLISCFVWLGSWLSGCHGSSPAQPSSGEPSRTDIATASSAPWGSAPNAVELARHSGSQSDIHAAPGPAEHDAGPADDGSAVADPLSTTPESRQGPTLVDGEGRPYPQTDTRPTVSSPFFRRRVEALAKAIISGQPELASEAFFPLVAYAQVKDIAKPERDYRFRLLANFERDVLAYHRSLGSSASDAELSGITVSERDVTWMAPGSEGNKLGYYRVLRARLRFTLPAGRSRDFEVTSLISWRGEWYVVHLHGFK